jgi:hypothetical protein
VSGVTRSIWLQREEDLALARYTRENDTSRGYVVRIALRLFLGLPVSSRERAELLERLAQDD